MAIIIPSKNIFSINNPKVVKNQLKSISINPNDVKRKDGIKTREVVNFIQDSKSYYDNYSSNDVSTHTNSLRYESSIDLVYMGEDDYGYNYIELQNEDAKSYITNCNLSFDNSSSYAKVTPKTAPTNLTFDETLKDDFSKVYQTDGFNGSFSYTQTGVWESGIIGIGNVPFKIEILAWFNKANFTFSSTVINTDTNDILVSTMQTYQVNTIEVLEEGSSFKFKVRTPTSIGINWKFFKNDGKETFSGMFNGTKISINISDIKLSIEKTISTLNVNQSSAIVIGDSENTDDRLNLGGNKLIQLDNEQISDSIINNYNDTISQYSNGKEIATILCSINDYYDTYGNKIIAKDQSTGKMLFDIYDEVLPMVSQPSHPNVPMSLLPNGNAKTFSVLGSRIYYDGAIWQELTIQEYDNIDYHIDGTLGLTYSLSEDGYAICTGINALYSPTEVSIPARVTINGSERDVVEIGESAFENNDIIENVTIGSNVKYINSRAFFGCSKLKEITIPDNVLEISTSAYENCSSVLSINIGKNVEYISDYAFANSSNVSEIYFNASECVSGRLPFIGTGATAGYGYADLTLYVGEEVNIIPAYMFTESSINYIYISSGLCHTIGAEAFYKSKNLTEVHIPRNIETIEQYAFAYTNLTTVWYEGTSEEWTARKYKITQGDGHDLILSAIVFGNS